MIIQRTAQLGTLNGVDRSAKRKADQAVPAFRLMPVDTVELGKPAATPESTTVSERQQLLNSIRQRVTMGFYGTESVIDDVSNSLAKAMEPTL